MGTWTLPVGVDILVHVVGVWLEKSVKSGATGL